jgi:hypothetical protein
VCKPKRVGVSQGSADRSASAFLRRGVCDETNLAIDAFCGSVEALKGGLVVGHRNESFDAVARTLHPIDGAPMGDLRLWIGVVAE